MFSPETGADDQNLNDRLERLEKIIQQQQAELEAQQQKLAEQGELIRQLQAERQSGQAGSKPPAGPPEPATADSYAQQASTETETSGASEPLTKEKTAEEDLTGEKAAAAELAQRQQEGTDQPKVDLQATLYDPSNTVYDPEFPGAWHLPGTTAAMKIGGYVNLAIVHNFDPIGSSDSFIVGTIPPEGTEEFDSYNDTSVTASQTRLNIEVREHTSLGILRAFAEGDFEGDGNTFRLRHAFGQYGWLLAGKTWSTFANLDALPEEVDFEGINGAILQRQSQLRFFPRLGKNYNLVWSIEDPTTDIQNGVGAKGRGDLVFSVDRLPLGELGAWNYKVAFLLRDLKGRYSPDGATDVIDSTMVRSTSGWGITTSGVKPLTFWGDDDFVQWQLTYGKGIGHYLNDLATIGGGDAVFGPDGKLHALPVLAGFLSYSHAWSSERWFLKSWPGLFRSNLMVSWVDIDNFDFQAGDSYNQTWRASTNLFYYPTQNVRLGAEFLWGERTNKDESKGSATQLQFSARYSFQ